MSKPMGALAFNMMSFVFTFRDLLLPPESILGEVGIEPGFRVLDYGCGPGSHSIAAARLAGQSGRVYAVDFNPLALQRVQAKAAREGLSNIETIHTDCATGLEDGSVDVVLLYDTFHVLSDPDRVLEELHQTLKPDSILSFSDHHMKEGDFLAQVTGNCRFVLLRKDKQTYSFLREG